MHGNRFKLIICDVDGTLIDDSEQITNAFEKLAKIIIEKEVPFTLASGRCPSQINNFIRRLRIHLPVIVNNGAGILYHNKLLYSHYMNPLYLKDAVLAADRLNMVIIMCDGMTETAYRYNNYIQNQIDRFSRYNHFYIPLADEWPDLKLQKVLIIDPQKPGKIDQVIQYLKPYEKHLKIVQYNSRSVDIMPEGTSKKAGILNLTKMLHIGPDCIMAVGNDKNDLEMISAVGVGIAVANAEDLLRQKVNYVCKNEYALGVLEAVERFYLNNK